LTKLDSLYFINLNIKMNQNDIIDKLQAYLISIRGV